MSDYLTHLAARLVGAAELARPRRLGLFEPQLPYAGDAAYTAWDDRDADPVVASWPGSDGARTESQLGVPLRSTDRASADGWAPADSSAPRTRQHPPAQTVPTDLRRDVLSTEGETVPLAAKAGAPDPAQRTPRAVPSPPTSSDQLPETRSSRPDVIAPVSDDEGAGGFEDRRGPPAAVPATSLDQPVRSESRSPDSSSAIARTVDEPSAPAPRHEPEPLSRPSIRSDRPQQPHRDEPIDHPERHADNNRPAGSRPRSEASPPTSGQTPEPPLRHRHEERTQRTATSARDDPAAAAAPSESTGRFDAPPRETISRKGLASRPEVRQSPAGPSTTPAVDAADPKPDDVVLLPARAEDAAAAAANSAAPVSGGDPRQPQRSRRRAQTTALTPTPRRELGSVAASGHPAPGQTYARPASGALASRRLLPAAVQSPDSGRRDGVVNVTIGRLEVQVAPPPAAPERTPRRRPALDLNDYLRQRSTGQHT